MPEVFLRALFLLVSGSVGYQVSELRGDQQPLRGIIIGLIFAGIIIAAEVVLSKRPIQSISAIVFGLIAGAILAFVFSMIAPLVVSKTMLADDIQMNPDDFTNMLKLSLIVGCCFLCVMVIYKTQDRFRFIIPYVEFQKEEKGARPVLVDTSAVIDGRLSDLCDTGVFDTTLIVPKFVLQELQHVADSGDRLRRNRGRRGLEMLQSLQREGRVPVQIHDGRAARGSTVDSKLVSLADQLQARILTCDYNLSKLAEIQNVDAINLNDLTNALRAMVLPGEELSLKIIRPGDEPAQGVGYLADGTMVVVDQARDHVGQSVSIAVTSTLQTSAGRMIFGRLRHDSPSADDKETPRKRQKR